MNVMVSIVVATYRQDEALFNALVSLAKQSFENFEVVLVDDNGDSIWNEKVRDIVERVREEYPQVLLKTVVNNPNQGSARTRNIGISHSQGEYVTFLDDDDEYMREKVKNQVLFMKEHNLDFCITDLNLYNEKNKLIDKRTREYLLSANRGELERYHLMYHMTGTDSMMFKRQYLLNIGGFDPIDLGDEFYLMYKAIRSDGCFGYLPVCDIKAYVHTGESGLSSGEKKIICENQLYCFKKAQFERLDKKAIKYIKMRHNAVLAFAYLRMHKYFKAVTCGAKSFFTSPRGCFSLLIQRKV